MFELLYGPLSKTTFLEKHGVELVYGDLTDAGAVRRALHGIDIVIHLGTALKGSQDFLVRCAVDGTQNIADAATHAGVKRVIYMSSMSVYDFGELRNGEVINENSALEEQAEKRGAYSLAKRRAEDIALGQLPRKDPCWTIVRPSMVIGKGSDVFAPAGVRVRNLLFIFGERRKHLRLVYVEDVANALLRMIRYNTGANEIYLISSDDAVCVSDYVNQYVKARYSAIRAVYVPYWVCARLIGAIRLVGLIFGKCPNISVKRVKYLYSGPRVNIDKLRSDLGWKPQINLVKLLLNESAR